MFVLKLGRILSHKNQPRDYLKVNNTSFSLISVLVILFLLVGFSLISALGNSVFIG